MKIRMILYLFALFAVVAVAKQVDVADKAYVKSVSIKADRDEQKVPIRRMRITTSQYNKNVSNILQVYVEAVDGKGVTYYGSAEAPQTRMRVDNWSQANWTVGVYLDGLDNAKISAYVIRYLAAEKKTIMDQKCEAVTTYEELADRNKDSQPLKVKLLEYDLLGF